MADGGYLDSYGLQMIRCDVLVLPEDELYEVP